MVLYKLADMLVRRDKAIFGSQESMDRIDNYFCTNSVVPGLFSAVVLSSENATMKEVIRNASQRKIRAFQNCVLQKLLLSQKQQPEFTRQLALLYVVPSGVFRENFAKIAGNALQQTRPDSMIGQVLGQASYYIPCKTLFAQLGKTQWNEVLQTGFKKQISDPQGCLDILKFCLPDFGQSDVYRNVTFDTLQIYARVQLRYRSDFGSVDATRNVVGLDVQPVAFRILKYFKSVDSETATS